MRVDQETSRIRKAQAHLACAIDELGEKYELSLLDLLQGVTLWQNSAIGIMASQRRHQEQMLRDIMSRGETITVLPEPAKAEVVLDDKDLRCEVYVCGTSRLTRVTHIPTGEYATCPGNDMAARRAAEDELKRKLAAQ